MNTGLLLIPIVDGSVLGRLRDVRYRTRDGLINQAKKEDRSRVFALTQENVRDLKAGKSVRAIVCQRNMAYSCTVFIDEFNRYAYTIGED